MKSKSVAHMTIKCLAVFSFALTLIACDGRANIARNTPPYDIDMRLELHYIQHSSYSHQITGWLYVDNYYDGDLLIHNDIEECGILHRRKGWSESYNLKYVTQFNGYKTKIHFDNAHYSYGTELIITPFIRDEDNHTYTGKPIEFQLR